MARKFYRKRKYGKRKRYGRKRYGRRSKIAKSSIVRSLSNGGGFPEVMQVKHKYFDNYTTTALVATGYTHFKEYRVNSVYDPEYASGTGQRSASYYAVMANIYRYYRVLGCKIVVTVAPEGSVNMMAVVLPYPETGKPTYTTASTVEKFASYPKARVKRGANNLDRVILSTYLSPTEIWGQPKSAVRIDSSYTAVTTDVSANPTKQVLFAVGVQDLDAAGNSVAIVTVSITYYVEWFGRRSDSDIPAGSEVVDP